MITTIRSAALALAGALSAAMPAAAQTPDAARHDYWTAGTSLPGKLFNTVAGTIGQLTYIAGGTSSSSDAKKITGRTLIYNPATKTYTTAKPIPTPTCCAASAVLQNKLYVFGGVDRNGDYLNTVWSYDPTANKWSPEAPMPTAREGAAATVVGTTAYVAGGNGSPSNLRLQAFEAYDAVHNTWTQLPPMPTGRSESSAGAADGEVVVAGGYTVNAETGVTEGYNIAANAWSTLATQPTPVSFACNQQIGSLLYVLNGTRGDHPLTTSQVYDITANTWASVAPGRKAVGGSASALSSVDGSIQCFGGTENLVVGGTIVRTVQVYHP